jgi:hypothetical protein
VESNSEHISEQSDEQTLTKSQSKTRPGIKAESNSTPKTKPLGDVLMPALICGTVGAVLTIILALIGIYGTLDLSLKEYYMAKPFYMPEPSLSISSPVWSWLLVVALTFGISFAVLDTDKQWCRVMMILLLSLVVILASPVLMLWEVFWSPVTVFVGVLWSWICAFIYSCQHTMPCEFLVPSKLKVELKEKTDFSPLLEQESDLEENYKPKDQSSCPD